MAVLRELPQRFHDGAHLANPAFEISDVRFSQAFYVSRGTLLVAPKREQGGDFFQRKAQIASATDKLKHSDVLITVIAVAVGAPCR